MLDRVRTKPLKVAFVGGAINSAAGRAHRTAIELDKKFSIVAGVFSRDEDISQSTAHEYGVPTERVYRSLEELIEREGEVVDAVVILTSQQEHFSQVLACLNAKIRVVCEKSLVSSSDEAQLIKEKIDTQGGFLRVISNYTGFPMVRELRSMIAAGRLGKIGQIHIEMPQEGFARVSPEGDPIFPQSWRLVDNAIPTVSLDLGVHLHMLVKFLIAKKPLEAVGVVSTFGNFTEIKDSALSIVKYEDDIICSMWYTKAALGFRNGLKIRIFGSDGAAEWIQESPENLFFADKFGNKFTIDRASPLISVASQNRYSRFKAGHPSGFVEAFANYYSDIHDEITASIRGLNFKEQSLSFGVDEALEGLNLLGAISCSSTSQQWEKI